MYTLLLLCVNVSEVSTVSQKIIKTRLSHSVLMGSSTESGFYATYSSFSGMSLDKSGLVSEPHLLLVYVAQTVLCLSSRFIMRYFLCLSLNILCYCSLIATKITTQPISIINIQHIETQKTRNPESRFLGQWIRSIRNLQFFVFLFPEDSYGSISHLLSLSRVGSFII